MSNETQTLAFIDAVYRRRYLASELARLFGAIRDLVDNVEPESRRALLVNLRVYLQKLADQLERTEEEIAEALPSMQYLLDAVDTPASALSEGILSALPEPDSLPPMDGFSDTDDASALGDEDDLAPSQPAPDLDADEYRDSWEAPPAPLAKQSAATGAATGGRPESWDVDDANLDFDDLSPSEPPDDEGDDLIYLHEDELPAQTVGEETLSPPFSAADGGVGLDDPDDDMGRDDTLRLRREVLSILDAVDTEIDVPTGIRSTHVGFVQMARPKSPNSEENEDAPPPEDAV